MKAVTIPYSEDLLISSGRTPAEFERELRLLLAIKLFELHRLSIGKAAEMSGLTKLAFMEELTRLNVAVINLDDDQIDNELSHD